MKRSVTIAGHRTSIWIEDEFWRALAEVAADRSESVSVLIEAIDRGRSSPQNLSSAIRVFILNHYRQYLSANGD